MNIRTSTVIAASAALFGLTSIVAGGGGYLVFRLQHGRTGARSPGEGLPEPLATLFGRFDQLALYQIGFGVALLVGSLLYLAIRQRIA